MLAETQWALIFGAAKKRGARWRDGADVRAYKAEVEQALSGLPSAPAAPSAGHRRISAKGKELIHSFESFKPNAYKDPGSKNGLPITIGWGSTADENGRPIKLGDVWTRERADAVFDQQIRKYEQAVDQMTAGVVTTQNQFDALVSLCYNIGIPALQKSTVLRRHRAGDYKGAADAFAMWNKNDGKVMRGLTRRRLAEADLYDD